MDPNGPTRWPAGRCPKERDRLLATLTITLERARRAGVKMVMARGLGEASRCRASQLGLPRAAFERAYLSLRTKSHESGAALTSYSASRIESGIIVPPSCHVAVSFSASSAQSMSASLQKRPSAALPQIDAMGQERPNAPQ